MCLALRRLGTDLHEWSDLMPDATIKAIETRYAGCHFRSRLEARWAVFFDQLGIKWEYEVDGFELSTGRYLPDFLLTDCSTWVEVRGTNDRVDLDHLAAVAAELPQRPLGINTYIREPIGGIKVVSTWTAERGPRLLLLGHPPTPPGMLEEAY
jgi:hypothetical protein